MWHIQKSKRKDDMISVSYYFVIDVGKLKSAVIWYYSAINLNIV